MYGGVVRVHSTASSWPIPHNVPSHYPHSIIEEFRVSFTDVRLAERYRLSFTLAYSPAHLLRYLFCDVKLC